MKKQLRSYGIITVGSVIFALSFDWFFAANAVGMGGITGLAQIRGRNNLTFRQRVCYDLSYQRHLTFRYDLNILFYTFLKVVEREGIQQRPDALSTPARVLKPRDLMTYGLKENTQLILRSIRKEPVPSLSVPAHPLIPKDLPTKGLRANTQLIMRSHQKSIQ